MKCVRASNFNSGDAGVVMYMSLKEAMLFKSLCRTLSPTTTEPEGTIKHTVRQWITGLSDVDVMANQNYITGPTLVHPNGESKLNEDYAEMLASL